SLAVAESRLREGNPWDPELVSAARKAEAQLITGVVADPLRQRVARLLADMRMLTALDQIRHSTAELRDAKIVWAAADAAYGEAFRGYGIDVDALAPAEAAAQVRERTIATSLVAALDEWAYVRRSAMDPGDEEKRQQDPRWRRLLDVARAA